MSTELENKDLTGNDAKPVLSVVLSDEEKELIFQKEREKYKGTSMEVELDYHKETFMSGIDALIEYINSR